MNMFLPFPPHFSLFFCQILFVSQFVSFRFGSACDVEVEVDVYGKPMLKLNTFFNQFIHCRHRLSTKVKARWGFYAHQVHMPELHLSVVKCSLESTNWIHFLFHRMLSMFYCNRFFFLPWLFI